MALGALNIRTRFRYSDRELVEQIAENPYLQYFIGLSGYQEEAPFDAGTPVLFSKRISAEMLMEVNEYLPAHKDDDNNTPPSSGRSDDNEALREDTVQRKSGRHSANSLATLQETSDIWISS